MTELEEMKAKADYWEYMYWDNKGFENDLYLLLKEANRHVKDEELPSKIERLLKAMDV